MENIAKYHCIICSPDYSSTICLPSLRLSYKNKKKYKFPFGYALGQIYPVLHRIFHYLPYDDLLNILKLENINWSRIAQNNLRRRHDLCWFSLQEESDNLVFCCSSNCNYECKKYLILMYNYKKVKNIQMNICIHENSIPIDNKNLMEYIEDNIIECDTMNCCILATDHLYPLFESMANSWFSAITLPEIDNVRIAAKSTIPDSPMSNFYMDKGENVLAVLIFSIGNPHSAIHNFIDKVLYGCSSKDVALIGGVANRVMTDVCCNELYDYKLSFLCIAFIEYQKSTCKAYSIVLRKEDDFESQIIKFKEDMSICKNTMLIRLTRNEGKGIEEDMILRKYFPNVPILGMETFGQCGWNKFPRSDDVATMSFSRKFEETFSLSYRTYATALMLLTWDN